jgi:hypothetical protein
MLRELDAVVAINEPQIGFYLGPFACDTPGVRASDLDVSNFTIRRLQVNRDQQFFATSYRDVWGPLLAQLLTERFRAHARRVKPQVPLRKVVIVVKEPNGSQSADIIMASQPKARLLFLLRDGRDVVDSLVAANEEGSWVSVNFPGVGGVPETDRLDLAVTSAYKWLWQTEVVQEAFKAHSGPKLLLRYEDLRCDPLARMTELIEWLGLRLDTVRLRALVERHSFEAIPEPERGPTKFYRAARPGLWRENLKPAERERVQEILGPKLRELGYES